MSRKGKCTNLANCVLAYRGELVEAPENDFNCPECREPLTPVVTPGGGFHLKLMPAVIGAAIVGVLALAFFVYRGVTQWQRMAPAEEEVVVPAHQTPPPAEIEESIAPTSIPAQTQAPVDSSASAVPATINLDPQSEQNAEVKAEVLKRIDLMPTISSENKDKLYFSVERARQMGNIVKIPFGFGQRELTPEDIEALRTAIQVDRVQKILEDPTAVLVLLGYADAKGDKDKNLKISQDRAESVGKSLRDQLSVLNVMHAVGMGSSTLFDESGNEKNRVVEVWVVLP